MALLSRRTVGAAHAAEASFILLARHAAHGLPWRVLSVGLAGAGWLLIRIGPERRGD